jgi:hypothetical protein
MLNKRSGSITNEFFELCLKSFTWKKLKTKGDFPRYWHVAVVTDDNQMIIHG